MKRPASVIVSAVLTLLASAIALVVAVAAFATRGELEAQVPTGGAAVAVVLAGFFAAGGILGIATAVDLLRLRRWARVSLLVFAGALVVCGGFSLLLLFAMPWDQILASVPNAKVDIRPILVGVYGLPVAVGAWWLFLFTRPSMKERFGTGQPVEPSALPVAVAVVGWMTLIGGVACLVLPFVRLPAFLFGLEFTGWTAALWYLAFAAAQLYAGWGLLKLEERGRQVALAVYALSTAQVLFAILAPGARARMLDLARASASDSPAVMDTTAVWWGSMAFALAVAAVSFWVLVRWKAAFQRKA